MNDPVGERLRSYYQSIQGDTPARLEARVAHALDSAAAARPARAPWRPAFGLLAAGAIVLVVALVVRNLGLGPTPTPTQPGVAGPTATPAATPTATPRPTATVPATEALGSPTADPSPTARPVGGLRGAAPMNPALTDPVAVRLSDGRVLITGGRQKQSNGITLLRTQTAEIYESDTDKFTPTGSMADARAGHTATLLSDGRVLAVGGIDASDGFDNLASAEIYDPATGKFTRTGSLMQGRAHHTATLLTDGRVLIAGGYGGGTLSLKSAEIYDPDTGKFTATGSMAAARRDATATLLPDGKVLIAGGLDQYATSALASAEIYDPDTGKFSPTGSMTAARTSFAAMGLEDDRVLVAGGMNASGSPLTSAEIYDPATGKFSPAGSTTAAGAFTAVWLKDTRVLFVATAGLSLYDPATGTFSPIAAPAGPVDTATYALGVVLLTEGGPTHTYQP
jgi:hypothetical protein